MMLSLSTAYRSFDGEVEASSTPTICRLPDSRRHQIWAIAPALLQLPAAATEVKPDVINAATFAGKLPSEDRISPLAIKVQVLLDRARFSPGEIDGRFGDNVEKALRGFREADSLPSGKVLTAEIWSKLQQGSGDPVIVEYALTDQDARGPF